MLSARLLLSHSSGAPLSLPPRSLRPSPPSLISRHTFPSRNPYHHWIGQHVASFSGREIGGRQISSAHPPRRLHEALTRTIVTKKRTVIKKKVKKGKSKALKEEEEEIELPAALAMHMGQLKRFDLNNLKAMDENEGVAAESADEAVIGGSAVRVETKQKKRDDLTEEDDAEEGEWDAEEDDDALEAFYEHEDDAVEGEEKAWWGEEEGDANARTTPRRRRSPPPYVPGRVMLDPENWTEETRDCLVEYVRRKRDWFDEDAHTDTKATPQDTAKDPSPSSYDPLLAVEAEQEQLKEEEMATKRGADARTTTTTLKKLHHPSSTLQNGNRVERVLGIVRRPRGVRHWSIQPLGQAGEERVNIYKIVWQWPLSTGNAVKRDVQAAVDQVEGHSQLVHSHPIPSTATASSLPQDFESEPLLQVQAKTMEEALEIEANVRALERNLEISPFLLWKRLLSPDTPQSSSSSNSISASSPIKMKRNRTRVILPKENSLRPSALHIMPADQLLPTPRRRELERLKAEKESPSIMNEKGVHEEEDSPSSSSLHPSSSSSSSSQHSNTIPDATQYVDIELAASILFGLDAHTDAIPTSTSPPSSSSTTPSLHQTTSSSKPSPPSPEHMYVAHKIMWDNDIFFSRSAHRGFQCRDPLSVLERLKQEAMQKEDAEKRNLFVAKLKRLLQASNTLEDATRMLPNGSLDASSVSSPSEESLRKSSSDSVDKSSSPSSSPSSPLSFSSEELVWLERLKQYALSGEDGEDAEVATYILRPLMGFTSSSTSSSASAYKFTGGDRPHHAFELLSKLGVISRFDNPHLLRYHLSQASSDASHLLFSKSQEKLASEIIKYCEPNDEGNDSASLPLIKDLDHSQRVDFSSLPAFAIDKKNAHEIDDAISLYVDDAHREWVYVHVADVGRYIPPNSILDLEARSRSTTLYLPDSAYGIFPDSIREHVSLGGRSLVGGSMASEKDVQRDGITATLAANGITPTSAASTHHQKRRQPVLSFGALLDGGGKIEEWKVVNGWIDSVERISYDELNEILAPSSSSKASLPLSAIESTGSGDSGMGSSESAASKSSSAIYASLRKSRLLLNSHASTTSSSRGSSPSDQTAVAIMSGKSLEERLEMELGSLAPTTSRLKRKYHETFIRLMDFATKRRSYRLDRRAVLSSVPGPEIEVRVDESGRASAHVTLSEDYNKNARGLVTEFMLMAGEVAGKFCRANSVPVYYLTQDIRKQEHERSLADLAHMATILQPEVARVSGRGSSTSAGAAVGVVTQEIMRNLANFRALRPAVFSTAPAPNFAQGLPLYVNVTSPLRRYTDLIAHHQIKAALRAVPAPFSLRLLHDLGTPLQAKKTELSALSAASSRFWVLQCLQHLTLSDPYKRFKALVIDSRSIKTSHESTLLLLDFGIQANITATRLFLRGETIWVRVDMINPFYDTLILKEVKNTPKKLRRAHQTE